MELKLYRFVVPSALIRMSDFMQELGEMALVGKHLSLEKSMAVMELLYLSVVFMNVISNMRCLPTIQT